MNEIPYFLALHDQSGLSQAASLDINHSLQTNNEFIHQNATQRQERRKTTDLHKHTEKSFNRTASPGPTMRHSQFRPRLISSKQASEQQHPFAFDSPLRRPSGDQSCESKILPVILQSKYSLGRLVLLLCSLSSDFCTEYTPK